MSNKTLNQNTVDATQALLDVFTGEQEAINTVNSRLYDQVGDKIRRLEKAAAEEEEKGMIPLALFSGLSQANGTMTDINNVTDKVNTTVGKLKRLLNENEEAKAKSKSE